MKLPPSLASIQKKKEVYDKEVKKLGKKALRELFESFFNDHPEIEEVYWLQYTPSFNDGDPCYFSYYGISGVKLVGKKVVDEEEPDDETKEGFFYPTSIGVPEYIQEAISNVDKILNGLEDVLQETFGEGAKVFASRNRKTIFRSEEYYE